MLKSPRGTKDILPDQIEYHTYIENIVHILFPLYGYRQIRTPVFEEAVLYERVSEEIVQKQMYTFKVKDKTYALRPEATAGIMRAYIEHRMDLWGKVVKLYYIGPMFRHERPQAGRWREFWQFGCEAIGTYSVILCAEILQLAHHILESLNLSNFVDLHLNYLGCRNDQENIVNKLKQHFSKYSQQLCNDCKLRLKTSPLRILDCKLLNCPANTTKPPNICDCLCEKCSDDFKLFQSYLKDMEIEFEIRESLVRGLDYYTHLVFEFIDESLGAQNALLAGGSYADLCKQLGGGDAFGIGFAGGIERIILAMQQHALISPKQKREGIYLALDSKLAFNLAKNLRKENIKVHLPLEENLNLRSHLKAADRIKAHFALFHTNDKFVLRNLISGDQLAIEKKIDELIRCVRTAVAN